MPRFRLRRYTPGVTTRAFHQLGWQSLVIAALLALPARAAEPVPGDARAGTVYLDSGGLELVLEPAALSGPAPEPPILVIDDQHRVMPGRVRSFAGSGRGLAVLVAIDVSGTMRGRPLGALQAGVAALAAGAGERDRIALVTFADELRVEARFGASREDLQQAVARLTPRGRTTRLAASLLEALTLLDDPALPRRRRLLVVSDGKEEGDRGSIEEVAAAALARGVVADAIGVTRVEPRHLDNLARLAGGTGGLFVAAPDEQGLQAALSAGIQALQASPLVWYDVSAQADGSVHRLSFGPGRPQLSLALPRRAVAAGPAERPARQLWFLGLAGVGLLALAGVGLLAWRTARSSARSMDPPGSEASSEAPPPRPFPAAEVPPAPPASAPRPRRRTQVAATFPAPELGSPCARLSVEAGPAAGRSFDVAKATFWIGALDGNDLQVAEDELLSGHHACLRFEAGSLLLHDNGATNGTFVNGERLAAAPRPLQPGDVIKVGASLLRLLPGQASP